jgi:hypothetical protein
VLGDLSCGSCASFCYLGCIGVDPKLSHILIRNMQDVILKKNAEIILVQCWLVFFLALYF